MSSTTKLDLDRDKYDHTVDHKSSKTANLMDAVKNDRSRRVSHPSASRVNSIQSISNKMSKSQYKMPIILVDTPSLPNLIEEESYIEEESTHSEIGNRLSTVVQETSTAPDEVFAGKDDDIKEDLENHMSSIRQKMRNNRVGSAKQTLKTAASKISSHKNAVNLVRDWMGIDESNPEQTFIRKQLKELKVGNQPLIEVALADECLKILENTHNHYMKLYNIKHHLCQVTHQRIVNLKKRINYLTISAKNTIGRFLKMFRVDKSSNRETMLSVISRHDSNGSMNHNDGDSFASNRSRQSEMSINPLGRHASIVGRKYKKKDRKQSMFGTMAKMVKEMNEDED